MPVITMLEGEDASRSWALGGQPVVLGRDAGCDIALADARSSRKHTRIHWTNSATPSDPPDVRLEDLGSKNGTWVNGRRVEGPTRLLASDKIQIGSTLFAFSIQLDEEHEQLRRLVQRATSDSLTALPNSEVFDRALRREFERARRYVRPLSLLCLNIDHLSKLNEVHGHRVGDLVLRQVGRILRDNLRLCDHSARIGGDEFAVLLPETGPEGALVVAERLRSQVHEFPMVLRGEAVRLSVSVGLASLDGTHSHPDAYLHAASRAAQRAKELGRNRVTLAG